MLDVSGPARVILIVGMEHMEDEECIEPPPPSPDKVARRAIVLSVVSCRGIVESDPLTQNQAILPSAPTIGCTRSGLKRS